MTIQLPMDPEERRIVEEKIARAFRVPYWVITGRVRPRWRDRPIWRWRALCFRYIPWELSLRSLRFRLMRKLGRPTIPSKL